MGVKNKTVGKIRYFTYRIVFPDGDEWVDQQPFVHDLQFELKRTIFEVSPDMKRDLLVKGSCHWKDNNSVVHRVIIEDIERPRRWGIPASGISMSRT